MIVGNGGTGWAGSRAWAGRAPVPGGRGTGWAGFRGFKPPAGLKTTAWSPSTFALLGTKPPGGRPNAGAANSTAPGQAQATTPTQQPQSSQQASPLDATFWNNVANNAFQTNSKINALNLQSGQDNTALQSALAQLAYQQPRSELALEERANQRGGLFSSVYNQQLGDLNYQFAGKQGGLIDKYGGDMAKIASEIAGLQGGSGVYDQGQALLAAERGAAQAAKNPATGSGALGGTGGGGGSHGGQTQQPPSLSGPGSNQPNSHTGKGKGKVPPLSNAQRFARAGLGAPKGNRWMQAMRNSQFGGF